MSNFFDFLHISCTRLRLHTEARLSLSIGKERRLPANLATTLQLLIQKMSQIPSLGRPRSIGSVQVPPIVALTPTPPPSDSVPSSDFFDPDRTPPPPAAPIFGSNIPEEKRFEVGSPRQRPAPKGRPVSGARSIHYQRRRAPSQRPLTGRPPAPPLHRGVKQPPPPRGPGGAPRPQPTGSQTTTQPGQHTANVQPTANSPTATQNPFEVLQTTLRQIQSYVDTLAAVSRQQPTQPHPPQNLAPTHGIPRAAPGPSSSPATLADLIASPQHSRKR